jgi:hypothetical protein
MTRFVLANHDMTAHVWAQQNQEHGRSPDGRIKFEGRTLYSYGSHFALGFIAPDGVALLNSDSYSVSTGKHKSIARGAVGHRVIHYVPELTKLARNFDSYFANYGPDSNKRFAAEIRAYVLKHAADLSDSAGPYLCGLIGIAKSWAGLQKERARLDAQAARKAAKNARDSALREAESWSAMTDSEFTAFIREALTNYDKLNRLSRLARNLRTSHKAAKDQKRFARGKVGTLWGRLQRIYKARRNLDAMAARAEHRKAARHAIKALRKAMAGDIAHLRFIAEHMTALDGRAVENTPESLAFFVTVPLQRLANRAVAMGATLRARIAGAIAEAAPVVTAERARLLAIVTAEAEAREAERIEKERATRESWFAGENVRFYARDAMGGAYLRAVKVEKDESGIITGGELQTSQGAAVPLTHALRAFQFLKAVKQRGESWHRNGRTLRVGNFQVDSIDSNGNFIAGCHKIQWSEVARVAIDLGVAGLAPDESAATPSH